LLAIGRSQINVLPQGVTSNGRMSSGKSICQETGALLWPAERFDLGQRPQPDHHIPIRKR
jgi:hypothetical protein